MSSHTKLTKLEDLLQPSLVAALDRLDLIRFRTNALD